MELIKGIEYAGILGRNRLGQKSIADGLEVCWATDLNAGGAALLIELLAAHAHNCSIFPDA